MPAPPQSPPLTTTAIAARISPHQPSPTHRARPLLPLGSSTNRLEDHRPAPLEGPPPAVIGGSRPPAGAVCHLSCTWSTTVGPPFSRVGTTGLTSPAANWAAHRPVATPSCQTLAHRWGACVAHPTFPVDCASSPTPLSLLSSPFCRVVALLLPSSFARPAWLRWPSLAHRCPPLSP
jgi:hypothetical protein